MIISLIDYRGLMILDFLFFRSEKLEKFYKYLAIKRYNYFGFRCVPRNSTITSSCIYLSDIYFTIFLSLKSPNQTWSHRVYSGCIVYNTCYNIRTRCVYTSLCPPTRSNSKGARRLKFIFNTKKKDSKKEITRNLFSSRNFSPQRFTTHTPVFRIPPSLFPFFSLLYKERGGEKNGIYRRIDRAIINSPGAGRSSLGILGGSRDKSRIVLYIADSPAGWLFFFFFFF